VVDYKALVGDTSDNIPGVPGVGEKTASALLEKFGTLDNIYAHLEDVEPRWRTKLEQGRGQAEMSRQLAQIRTDLQITSTWNRRTWLRPGGCGGLLESLEFARLSHS
jgi:DNA polymerase-1